MSKNKLFSKAEIISLIVIFGVLVGVSIPNFIASLRRARDQVRRDDMGVLVHDLDEYMLELGVFPPSSPDGEIMDCLKPGDSPYKDAKGNWVINPIPCIWGKDAFVNLISGRSFLSTLPRDPKWEEGRAYFYRSDSGRYQLFAALEGPKEAEYSKEVVDMGVMCGNEVCNTVRTLGCDIPKTIELCAEEAMRMKR